MVRNEWHPLVRLHLNRSLKLPWRWNHLRLVSTRLWHWTALAEFFIVPRIWFRWEDWDERWDLGDVTCHHWTIIRAGLLWRHSTVLVIATAKKELSGEISYAEKGLCRTRCVSSSWCVCLLLAFGWFFHVFLFDLFVVFWWKFSRGNWGTLGSCLRKGGETEQSQETKENPSQSIW